MNVIITSHAKTKWEKTGDSFKEAGTTFDCYPKLDYLFDLVFEIQKRGKDRVGIVRKSRVGGFPEGEVFPFSYDEIATRYGRDILERRAATVVLATAEQVTKLKHLIDVLHIEEAVVEKWLDKAQAESLNEMPAEAADKCIKFMLAKVEATNGASDKTDASAAA